MKTFKLKGWLLGLALTGAALSSSAGTAGVQQALPGNSIYQLNATMTDQNGHEFRLSSRRGRPVIISMFYNSCQFVCPMLIDTLRATEDGLTAAQREKIGVLLVTFDPQRDTVAVLKAIATKRQVNTANWTLARTDAASVRKLAAVLGIQYRLLDNGDYNHTTALILLDREGRIVGTTNEIGEADPQFLKLVQSVVDQ